MHLGAEAYTVASNLVLVVILVLLILRVLLTPHGAPMKDVIDLGFRAAVSIGAVGLILERLYYVLARILRRDGVDLWMMHPAPEVLSIVVAFGIYGITVPMIFSAAATPQLAVRRVIFELIGIAGFWAALVWVLF